MGVEDVWYQFFVAGEPQGKGRPRVTTRGGYAHAYTPKKTVDYEQDVRAAFIAQCTPPETPLDLPLELFIEIQHGIPKSVPKKDRAFYESNLVKPMKKPDIDNVIKVVTDAMIGLVYKDDTQITMVTAHKGWSVEPRVVVQIRGATDL